MSDKPTRLAIGVEGGFKQEGEQKVEVEETLSVVTMPEAASVSWPCGDIPQQVRGGEVR